MPEAEKDRMGPDAPTTQSLFVDFLRSQLSLAVDQALVYNQKWRIPADDRLYIVVSSIGPDKPWGAAVEMPVVTGEQDLNERLSVPTREMIAIDLFSRGQVAIDRKWELPAILASTAMQQLCEDWSISVARIPVNFVDLSSIEGPAMLSRYRATIVVLRTRTLTRKVPIFDTIAQPALVINP